MKLFKTKYDITLNEVSLMFETSNPRLLCTRKHLPAFLINRAFEKFMIDFTELFNKDEVSDLLADDFTRLKIKNRIFNLYAPLYQGLLLSEDDRLKELYKKHFGKDYEGIEDLKIVLTEIERLKGKYKELGNPDLELRSTEKMSFEQIITYVEMALDRNIDRGMKLYQFKYQYDLAVKRAKEWENKNG